jgi:hypothetical protein
MPSQPDLDDRQREIVLRLVEADRTLTPDQRAGFYYSHGVGNPTPTIELSERDEDIPISWGDMEILYRAGLIVWRPRDQSSGTIHLTPAASKLYEQLRRSHSEPSQAVESAVREFLDAHAFRQRFPAAYEAWHRASDLLWARDSTIPLSTMGHLCREAMQEFAARLVGVAAASGSDPDRPKTVDRLRSAITRVASSTDRAFLDALVAYWGTVSDLVQRQEHAGQKDGTPVTWEDARRVVFQTAIVMFEVASTVRR